MRRIEKRGEVNVLCDDYGCSPATKAEAEFFDEITRLRAEAEVLRADSEMIRTEAWEWIADERAHAAYLRGIEEGKRQATQ